MTKNDADEGEESPDRDRVLDESQSKVLTNGLKAGRDVNDGGRRESISQTIIQVQQQQSQGTAVDWERFLHIRSIKVLLVENDDSTRHIVTALLRNCNYEVIEAADGVQAWRILEDLTNQVDLVLTEVVMPCLSGIGLLCKIMSHRTRKIIPVIMMSSHDSMGLVFKCLSKGAVDFLVKPIRKNELKNLWQHVWRRCHSSSGSGSESGAPTQKSVHTRSSEKSDDSSSDAGENNGSNGLNNIDGSDDGSGTQSSWTKQPIEADISPATSPTNQVAKCLHNKCAQVNELNAETSCNKRVQITAKKEGPEEEQSRYEDPLPNTTNILDSETQSPLDACTIVTGAKLNSRSEVPSRSGSSRMGKEEESPEGKSHPSKNKVVIDNFSHPQTNSGEFDHPRESVPGQKVENNPLDNPRVKEMELSLKRLRGIEGSEKTISDSSNLLKHSEHSAFSRYNTSTSAAKASKATGSSCKNENSLEDVNRDSLSGHTNGNVVFPNSVGSNFIGVGSLTNTFSGNPIFFSEALPTVNVFHPFSAFQHVKSDPRNNTPLAAQVKSVDMQASSVLSPTRGVHLELQEHHYHHFQNFEQEHNLSNHEKSSMERFVAEAAPNGLLNIVGGPEAGDRDNCCANGSGSGSNYGSSHQNGSCSAVNTGLINGESGTLGQRIDNTDATRSGFGNRIDENKLAQREAALLKFRQKRKERCFKKKVRYQNRKRLAEQRPRVRGQFVRQTEHSSSNDAASTDE